MSRELRIVTVVAAIVMYSALVSAALSLWGPGDQSPVVSFMAAAFVGTCAAVGFAVKKARDRKTGAGSPDGVELHVARNAQAGAFIDVILFSVVIIAVQALFPLLLSGKVAVMLIIVCALGDVWIRYALRVKNA